MDEIYQLLTDMWHDMTKWATNHLPHTLFPWLFDD
tara:strand:+ start:678 stop:782 length:105 start_codon:yes stop_codon:yes gene_type:complete